MSDPGISYRGKDEVKSWKENQDPIKKFEKRILESGLAKEDELKKIEAEVKKEVDDAIQQAKNDPLVDEKELPDDCYVQWNSTVRIPGFLKFAPHTHKGHHKASN